MRASRRTPAPTPALTPALTPARTPAPVHAASLIVVKVGGGLLTDAPGLLRVAAAVADRRARGDRVLVVVSALKGVTDALERATLLALDPRAGLELVRDVMERLRGQHAAVARALPAPREAQLRMEPVFDSVERLLTGIRLTGELTPRMRDLVMAHGERLAAPLVAAAVLAAGADARAVTAEEAGLVATGPFRTGSCHLAASAAGLAALQHELFDRVLVLTGFYGVNADGDVVLFGRGGTDYTAGIVAAGLAAAELQLWKDVPGFMTADPGEVPGAYLIPELSFDEACELGLYGARILHPRCLDPLRGLPVAVSVRSVHAVDEVGTVIVERRAAMPATRPRRASRPPDSRGAPAGPAQPGTPARGRIPSTLTALAARRNVALVRVQSAAMVNVPGVAGRILSSLGVAGINVDAVAASMTSLSCSIDGEQAPLARRTLRLLAEQGAAGVEDVSVREGVALLGAVGDGVAADPSIAARLLSCLADLGIAADLVCHGPGDVGLSCAVPEADLQRALAALHDEFFGAARGTSRGRPRVAAQAARAAGRRPTSRP